MVARTLITTADEHTWPKDESEPVIFLGEWCKIYSNKEKWEKFDSVTAQYHWDDRKKLHKDFVFLQEVYEKYLLIISNKMNKIHSVSYTVRYWRILMGPWLGYFIQIIYDRLMMIEEVYDKHDVLICNIIDSPYCVMVPQDMNDFVDKIVGDEWNQWVYKELIKFRGETSYNILREEFQVNGETNDRTRGKIKSFAKRALNSLSFLSANNKYFFISSYLSVSKQVHLELLLGQVPSIYRSSPIIPNIDIDKHCRDQLVFDENETYFESFLSYLLPLQIPAIYLENYEKLINEIEKVRWPTSPENILTANAHYFDDFFKAWSAGKVEKECKLTIIQHGGLRWTSMWSFHEEHERKICDNYFSWGVECSEDKAIRALPSGKIMSNKNKINHSPSGGLLQVVSTLPRYRYHLQAVPVASQQQIYEDEQIIFAQGLRKDILKKLTVRLSVADWGWEQAERWKESFDYIKN